MSDWMRNIIKYFVETEWGLKGSMWIWTVILFPKHKITTWSILGILYTERLNPHCHRDNFKIQYQDAQKPKCKKKTVFTFEFDHI